MPNMIFAFGPPEEPQDIDDPGKRIPRYPGGGGSGDAGEGGGAPPPPGDEGWLPDGDGADPPPPCDY